MRIIIDSNMLESEELRIFLTKPTNIAVLTDYLAMEAYKDQDGDSIHRRMGVLATRPRQVIVLKSTLVICGLKGRRARLQQRMTDLDQTGGFATYCRDLELFHRGDKSHQSSIWQHGQEANRHLTRVLNDAQQMGETIDLLGTIYSAEELRTLRSREKPRDEMLAKTLGVVQELTWQMLERHPRSPLVRSSRELANTFIFRFALCSCVWALRWMAVGGATRTKPEKLRNDIVDISFVVYGSFFDGLMSADKKANELYRDLHQWLGLLADFSMRQRAMDGKNH